MPSVSTLHYFSWCTWSISNPGPKVIYYLLTQVSGFQAKPDSKSGISIMTDHHFTIKDMLHKVVAEFNLPTLMEGRAHSAQSPGEEVQGGGRSYHCVSNVEQAKNLPILTETRPLWMAWLSCVYVLSMKFFSQAKSITSRIINHHQQKQWEGTLELQTSDHPQE